MWPISHGAASPGGVVPQKTNKAHWPCAVWFQFLAQSPEARRNTMLTVLVPSAVGTGGGLADFAGGDPWTCLHYGNIKHHFRGAAGQCSSICKSADTSAKAAMVCWCGESQGSGKQPVPLDAWLRRQCGGILAVTEGLSSMLGTIYVSWPQVKKVRSPMQTTRVTHLILTSSPTQQNLPWISSLAAQLWHFTYQCYWEDWFLIYSQLYLGGSWNRDDVSCKNVPSQMHPGAVLSSTRQPREMPPGKDAPVMFVEGSRSWMDMALHRRGDEACDTIQTSPSLPLAPSTPPPLQDCWNFLHVWVFWLQLGCAIICCW